VCVRVVFLAKVWLGVKYVCGIGDATCILIINELCTNMVTFVLLIRLPID
jgi:hypothetical protein